MNLSRNKVCQLCAWLLLFSTGTVQAEKADREMPIHIESDRMSVDDAKHVSVFEGKVELMQGSLRVIAEKLVVTDDGAGNKFGVATGHLASFRQKRDGTNEYVEGEAERIEYDTHSETVNFFVNAHVKRAQDEVRGDHITYSTQTENFRVSGTPSSGRVSATIQPKSKDSAAAPKNAEPKNAVNPKTSH